MTGTLRTHDPALRSSAEDKLRRIVDGVASAYGARAQLDMIFGYPPVINDAALAEAFAAYTREHGFSVERPAPTMGGEDFAYFAQRVPGVMVRLGIYNEAVGSVHSGHSPQFRLDEKRGDQISRTADTGPRVIPEARHKPTVIRREHQLG